MEEEQEDMDTELSIMSLPRELRGIIYNKIPQEHLVPLRRVCHAWREEIDDLCEFSVELDDRKPNWTRILDLRIKSCEIVSFIQPPPQGLGTTILTHPNLIRKLQILTNQISPNNLYFLLSDCSSSLCSFSLQLAFPNLCSVFPTSFSDFNFGNVIEFELSISTTPPMNQANGLEFHDLRKANKETLFTQFMQNPMRNLQHLKIELELLGREQASKFTSLVLVFLSSHWQKLVTLDIDIIQGRHGIASAQALPLEESDLKAIALKTLDKLSTLKDFRLISSSVVGVDMWIRLIENQKCLEFCEVDILPAPISVFRTIIFNNFNTLKALELCDLTVWNSDGEPEPFDLSILKPCNNLKKLVLDRNMTARRRYDCAELINLSQLPGNLNELALNYFNILSEDLLAFSASEAGAHVKNLTYTQCGKEGDYGVTGTVLEATLALESIIFIEISILNFSNPEERVKLNRILDAHGYSEDHAYFQHSKLTSLIQGLLDMDAAQNLLRMGDD